MHAKIESIVTLVLAGLAACGGSASSDTAQTTPETADGGRTAGDAGKGTIAPFPDDATFTCTAPLPPLAPGLRPGVPVDYIELRGPEIEPGATNLDGGGPRLAAASTAGVPCATATEKDTCLASLREARAEGWQHTLCGPPLSETQFVVYTRGNTVGTAADVNALAALLAPIDTEEEARLVLLASRGVELRCLEGPARNGIRKNADGSYEIVATYGGCPSQRTRFKVETSGAISVLAEQDDGQSCQCGRRFDGLESGPSGGATAGVGAYLAEMAYLEAASVIAFRRFEGELRALGAPRSFLVRARAARADEIRHAAEMRRLARRFGGRTAPVHAAPSRTRTPYEIALENAVEGCVRETYGALVAAYQARTAADPELRLAMRRIARDEAAHASLAHDVAAWLEPRLEAAERDAIGSARRAAVAALEEALATGAHPEVLRIAGLPGPDAARRLLASLADLTATSRAA